MAKFAVTFSRSVRQYFSLQVEAESADEVRAMQESGTLPDGAAIEEKIDDESPVEVEEIV